MRSNPQSAPWPLILAIVAVTIVTGTRAVAHEKILHAFGSKSSDGIAPYFGLVFDSAGNLYGTTSDGGAYSGGIIFELSPAETRGWFERSLFNFQWAASGSEPLTALILDPAGNLFGTTFAGGTYGKGAAFELRHWPDGGWSEQVLHSFGAPGDGYAPVGGMVRDRAGNFYGTTQDGGAYDLGTVYELSPTVDGGWTETILHSFGNGTDGRQPSAGLVFDPAGNLYGTTESGGANKLGTMFELKRSSGCGWVEKVAYSFGNSNGAGSILPLASLTVDAAGNLYGTALGGSHNLGTVFKLSRATRGAWKETVLHNFGKGGDGSYPSGGLLMDAAGNLYGTTGYGGVATCTSDGVSGCGTVFKVSPAPGGWTEKILHSFGNGNDGINPFRGVISDVSGNLYGTTEAGGIYGHGTVFEIAP
jgi:uncharacterized repeat protein (TIGR03803 family)